MKSTVIFFSGEVVFLSCFVNWSLNPVQYLGHRVLSRLEPVPFFQC